LDPSCTELEIEIPPAGLPGILVMPPGFTAVVVFAHGSTDGTASPRNHHVAQVLRKAGFATVLPALLTGAEATDRVNAFDVHLQSERLLQALRHLRSTTPVEECPAGLFGACTGAAAALIAAARAAEHDRIGAVVARGGRPDMAEAWLDGVAAPTLLIVGGHDLPTLDLNRQALARLHGVKAMEIVPGASHLFTEPGALDAVAAAAAAWFTTHLVPDL
jgi:pimeloyl-ACP methyl ester carboxylesterase